MSDTVEDYETIAATDHNPDYTDTLPTAFTSLGEVHTWIDQAQGKPGDLECIELLSLAIGDLKLTKEGARELARIMHEG